MPFLNDNKWLQPGRRARTPSVEEANAIAIEALSFIAGDERLLQRFAGVTGLDVSSLRKAAASPQFLPSVLDFVLAHEPTLESFCLAGTAAPQDVAAARRVLSPDDREPS